MNKSNIDRDAEKEAKALRKQGRYYNHRIKRIRQQVDYNVMVFDKLFRSK